VAGIPAALVILVAHAAAASPIRVYQSPDSAAITEGETTLDVDADTAYAAAVDYARWTQMFPDIAKVNVTRRLGDDARVTFVHRDGNRDNVHFHNTPQAGLVWFEDTGGRATVWAEIVFIPGDRPGTTRVHTRLYADVHGIASLVVSGRDVRAMRERRVASDLANLRAYFARPTS
jgi:hypothetical protein